MTLILIALTFAAIYSGGMYLLHFVSFLRYRAGYKANPDAADRLERVTFHLGLCFILAVGFLGLILGEA